MFLRSFIIFLALFISYSNAKASVDNTGVKDEASSATATDTTTTVQDINTTKVLRKDDKRSEATKENDSALDTVEMYEGEAITGGEVYDVGKTLLRLSHLDQVKPPFFDSIENNVILSQAMMNTQQETGDPLFILLSRQNSILKSDTLYLGGDAAFTPAWLMQRGYQSANMNSINNYYTEYYFLSTLGEWTSVFGSLSLYTTNGDWTVDTGGLYFILGDLNRSPLYTYAAISTVNFGNFDIASDFIPTLTRLYFMQSGGNLNLSYNANGLQANFVFLAPSQSDFLGVTNAYTGNNKLAFSLNMKYIYDMATVGNYWYVGAAYSNVSGFTNGNNHTPGVVDLNFGMNISKLEFINEFAFTDSGVSQLNSSSTAFGLREGFFASSFPTIGNLDFLTTGGHVFSWSSQLDYTANVYNKSLVPYITYSQIQQRSDNFAAAIDTGFRYNAFADAWIGTSYTYTTAKVNDTSQRDNIVSLYMRIFI